MMIFENWAQLLRREGRLTLQVPQFSLSWGGSPRPSHAPPNLVGVPDEWFCFLNLGVPAVGRMEGFLYISRLGYEANRQEILDIYAQAAEMRWSPKYGEFSHTNARDRFEQYATEHFETVRQKHAILLAKTRAKANPTPYWERKLEELEAFPL